MTGLLQGELIKLRTTRTALGFAAVTLLLMLLAVLLGTLAGDPTTLDDKRSTLSMGSIIAFVLIIFGAVGATGEHRHGTITSALLIAPDRIRVTAAKLAAYAAAGALVGLVVQLLAIAIGLPLLSGEPGPDLSGSDLLGIVAGTVVACGLCAAIGVGVGALLRNQVATVVIALVYLFIIEPLISGFVPEAYAYLIGGASSAVAGGDVEDGLAPVVAGVVLLGWALLFSAVAVVADRNRDVN